MSNQYLTTWGDDAIKKTPFRDHPVTFIAASRKLSLERIKQIIQRYLTKGDIVWGVAQEEYIRGFEGQPQFEALQQEDLEEIIVRVNERSKHKIHILLYKQEDIEEVVQSVGAKKYRFVRGSWQYAFHTQPLQRVFDELGIKPEFLSPFADDAEAENYAKDFSKKYNRDASTSDYQGPLKMRSVRECIELVQEVAKNSFDHSFQIGAVAAERVGEDKFVVHRKQHNIVVPYETYAMHKGFSREVNKVPTQDLNHYDTVHAETALFAACINDQRLDTLFINVLPCRTCARHLLLTGVQKIYYLIPHSDDPYTMRLFEDAGVEMVEVTSS